jgi:hypothetical protein
MRSRGSVIVHANQLIHPWQLTATWRHDHPLRRRVVVITTDQAERSPVVHWWTAPAGNVVAAVHRVTTRPQPRVLPDSRAHYYPARCDYLETSSLARMMDHL